MPQTSKAFKADSNGNYSFSRWIGNGYRFKTRCNGVNSDKKRVQVEQDPGFQVSPPSQGSVSFTVTNDPKDAGHRVIILGGGDTVGKFQRDRQIVVGRGAVAKIAAARQGPPLQPP